MRKQALLRRGMRRVYTPRRMAAKRKKKPGRPKVMSAQVMVRMDGELEKRLHARASRWERGFADTVRRVLRLGLDAADRDDE